MFRVDNVPKQDNSLGTSGLIFGEEINSFIETANLIFKHSSEIYSNDLFGALKMLADNMLTVYRGDTGEFVIPDEYPIEEGCIIFIRLDIETHLDEVPLKFKYKGTVYGVEGDPFESDFINKPLTFNGTKFEYIEQDITEMIMYFEALSSSYTISVGSIVASILPSDKNIISDTGYITIDDLLLSHIMQTNEYAYLAFYDDAKAYEVLCIRDKYSEMHYIPIASTGGDTFDIMLDADDVPVFNDTMKLRYVITNSGPVVHQVDEIIKAYDNDVDETRIITPSIPNVIGEDGTPVRRTKVATYEVDDALITCLALPYKDDSFILFSLDTTEVYLYNVDRIYQRLFIGSEITIAELLADAEDGYETIEDLEQYINSTDSLIREKKVPYPKRGDAEKPLYIDNEPVDSNDSILAYGMMPMYSLTKKEVEGAIATIPDEYKLSSLIEFYAEENTSTYGLTIHNIVDDKHTTFGVKGTNSIPAPYYGNVNNEIALGSKGLCATTPTMGMPTYSQGKIKRQIGKRFYKEMEAIWSNVKEWVITPVVGCLVALCNDGTVIMLENAWTDNEDEMAITFMGVNNDTIVVRMFVTDLDVFMVTASGKVYRYTLGSGRYLKKTTSGITEEYVTIFTYSNIITHVTGLSTGVFYVLESNGKIYSVNDDGNTNEVSTPDYFGKVIDIVTYCKDAITYTKEDGTVGITEDDGHQVFTDIVNETEPINTIQYNQHAYAYTTFDGKGYIIGESGSSDRFNNGGGYADKTLVGSDIADMHITSSLVTWLTIDGVLVIQSANGIKTDHSVTRIIRSHAEIVIAYKDGNRYSITPNGLTPEEPPVLIDD